MQRVKRACIKFAKFIKFLTANFKGVLLFLLLLYLLAPTSKDGIINANLVRINLSGAIIDSEKTLKELEEARLNKSIKGVLFVINSPGGAVAPSIELAYAIKRLAREKPVVSYAAGSMASGSYYAAIWSSKIVANPGSVIGSIGVIMQGYNIEELLDKIGIKPQTAKSGSYKEAGTINRNWSKLEREEIEKVIKQTYTMFVSDVVNARNLQLQDQDIFADAHIFTSLGALNVGLIDSVGTIYEAVETLKELSGVTKPVWKEPSAIDSFVERLSTSFAHSVEAHFPPMVLK